MDRIVVSCCTAVNSPENTGRKQANIVPQRGIGFGGTMRNNKETSETLDSWITPLL
jgi:hypothetical protein